MPADISVIIVNYNAGDRLALCLEKLKAQSFQNFDIIIVDNASSDSSLETIDTSAYTDLEIIPQTNNLGFAAAVNIGARASTAPWIALLNPDAYPAESWLQELYHATQNYENIGALGSLQINHHDPAKLDGVGDVYHVTGIAYRGDYGASYNVRPLKDGKIFAPCAAAALYRKDIFLELGGMDERFFCYFEDVDIGFRLQAAGYESYYIASAVVYHEGSAISGRRSAFTVYHGTRNRIWSFFKNMPLPLFIILMPVHFIMNILFLARAMPLGVARPYLRGMKDGFLKVGPMLKSRQDIKQMRRIKTKRLAEKFTWSLGKLLTRSSDVRLIPEDETNHGQ